MRFHRKLVEVRSGERNRILKHLETANIKLSSVATNVFGKSGMAMLEAIAKGEDSGEALAELAQGLLKKKAADLRMALEGRVAEHHRFVLEIELGRLKAVQADLAKLERYIEEKMAPYPSAAQALTAIPGVGVHTARTIISEIGVDMSVFKTPQRLAAWAGVAPGNNESAGKRLGGRTRKGNVHLRTALVESSMSAVRKKGSYLRSKYYRIKARMGVKRAAVAIAHKILIAAFHILTEGTVYQDLGDTCLDGLNKTRTARQLVRRLETRGFRVGLEPVAPEIVRASSFFRQLLRPRADRPFAVPNRPAFVKPLPSLRGEVREISPSSHLRQPRAHPRHTACRRLRLSRR